MVDVNFENIYLCLQGQIVDEEAIPWVPDAFEPGSYCDQEYSKVLRAYHRLNERLTGDQDKEDPDLMQMQSAMEAIQQELCRMMFSLGLSIKLGL